jgi:hypothetical protein
MGTSGSEGREAAAAGKVEAAPSADPPGGPGRRGIKWGHAKERERESHCHQLLSKNPQRRPEAPRPQTLSPADSSPGGRRRPIRLAKAAFILFLLSPVSCRAALGRPSRERCGTFIHARSCSKTEVNCCLEQTLWKAVAVFRLDFQQRRGRHRHFEAMDGIQGVPGSTGCAMADPAELSARGASLHYLPTWVVALRNRTEMEVIMY